MSEPTDRWIRAMLRGATDAGILDGWQGPHTNQRSYCINPIGGAAREQPLEDAVKFCMMLVELGVEPLYRLSEPSEAEMIRRRHG